MFGEDEKTLAGDLANYNWKIFACSVVFDTIYFWKADMAGRFLLRPDGATMQAGTTIFNFISI
jgi:hypothetical protein